MTTPRTSTVISSARMILALFLLGMVSPYCGLNGPVGLRFVCFQTLAHTESAGVRELSATGNSRSRWGSRLPFCALFAAAERSKCLRASRKVMRLVNAQSNDADVRPSAGLVERLG